MQAIGTITLPLPLPSPLNKRQMYLKEIYEYYAREKDDRRITNWKRYCLFLRKNKIQDTGTQRASFKKTKQFIKEFTPARFSYFLSHIPTDDLPYFVSTAREFTHTKRNFTAWLSTQMFSK